MRKSFAFQNGLGLPVLLENQCTVLSPSLLYWGGRRKVVLFVLDEKKWMLYYCGNDFSSPENLIKEEILCMSNSTIE